MWLNCAWYFTLWREFNICVLLWKCKRSRKKPKTDIPLHAYAKLTICLLSHLPTPRNYCKTVMFGSCWCSEQLWLTGTQFWLSHVVAKNTVSEFRGVYLCRRLQLPAWRGQPDWKGVPGSYFPQQASQLQMVQLEQELEPLLLSFTFWCYEGFGVVLWWFIQLSL